MLSITKVPPESHDLTVTDSHHVPFAQLDVVSQVKRAFTGHPLAALLGFGFGGLVPLITFITIRAPDGVDARPVLWLIAGGGLIYSAATVFTWAQTVFGSWLKAGAFVCLTESAMALERTAWIAYTVLALLILVNGVAASIALQIRPDGASDAAVQSLGLAAPSVVVNVQQANVAAPRQRTAQASRSDAQRREGDARRSREYRARKRHEMASQTVTPEDK